MGSENEPVIQRVPRRKSPRSSHRKSPRWKFSGVKEVKVYSTSSGCNQRFSLVNNLFCLDFSGPGKEAEGGQAECSVGRAAHS